MKIACIGGAHIDRHAVLKARFIAGTSNPGNITTSFGGVARNVAENLARLGCRVSMVSRVGNDEAGAAVITHLRTLDIGTSQITIAARPTATYTAILEPDGELVMGLADMDIYEEVVPATLDIQSLREHALWFLDANLPAETLAWLLDQPGEIPVAVDAISVPKSRKLQGLLPRIAILFVNLAQAAEISGATVAGDAPQAARALHAMGARAGIVTAGAGGVAVWACNDVCAMPALSAVTRNVTGAGDALIAGTLYGIAEGRTLFEAAPLGLAAAAITVETHSTTAAHLTADILLRRSLG